MTDEIKLENQRNGMPSRSACAVPPASRLGSLIKKILLTLIVLGLIVGSTVWYFRRGNAQAVSFRTAPVTKGDLTVVISATGTVEPEEVVDVGAQIAGQILTFGKDVNGKSVDYGSRVESGTVLAKIDDSLYSAEAAQCQAQVQAARANIQRSEADLQQLQSKLHQAERDWARAQKLGPSEALAQSSYDAYRSAYETARANVEVGQAAILQAKAGLAQAEAVLGKAKRNLSYCTITSPVNGVVIDRRVNIGQTVVASLNAPSLFLIAKDLNRMQVWVAVNEADIGKIRPGQTVTFTIDAFPGETFRGEVGKIRLNASMTQNVVTYTVEIITDNSNGRLLPYLTANVRFELERRDGVLQVPNMALRWTPATEQVAPEFRDSLQKKGAGKKPGGPGSGPGGAQGVRENRGTVWVTQDAFVKPVRVKVGLSDGARTEVEGKDLQEGMMVVVGIQEQSGKDANKTSNPFTPQFGRGPGAK